MTLKIKSVEPEARRNNRISEGRRCRFELGVCVYMSAFAGASSHKGSNYKNMFATVLILSLE